jgi:hypothetical protein
MNSFSNFGIKSTAKNFEGEKIKIDRILNKQITVEAYKIEQSKFEKGNGKRLDMQIVVDNTKRIVFTGSINLMDMILQVLDDKLPFTTTIVRENERLIFT